MFTEHDVYQRLSIRSDVWSKQNINPDEKGRYGYTTQKYKLSIKDIVKSLQTNECTIGVYTVKPSENTVINPTIDLDNHDGKTDIIGDIRDIYYALVFAGLHPYIEASAGDIKDGAHIGMICKPTSTGIIKKHIQGITAKLSLQNPIEINPKNENVKEGDYGNLVKLPFQYHNRTKARSQIYEPLNLKPLSRQNAINYMMELEDSVFPEIPDIQTPIPTIKEPITATTEPIKSDLSFDDVFGISDDIKPCIKKAYNEKRILHGKGDEGHNFRVAIAGNLLYHGYSEDLVHAYFRVQADYSKKHTTTQIKSIKEYLADNKKPMGCKAIKDRCATLLNGMCETCPKKPKNKKRNEKEPISSDKKEIINTIHETYIESFTNQMELAKRFQKINPIYYDSSRNYWLWIKDEGYYLRIDETDVLAGIYDNADCAIWHTKERIETLECIKITGRKRQVKAVPATWIHTKSGIIDYESGETIQATPDYFLTRPIPHKIGLSDTTPKIDKLFDDWVGADRKLFLYEWLAYCLVDSYPIHRMFIAFGSGRNGKSQYAELISRFVGKENTTSTELEKVIESRFEAVKLYKKKVALIGETNFSQIKSSARIKALTGADMITVEYKGKDAIDIYNTAKIFISTNNIPESLDKTEAFYSRCIIEEFKNRFDDGVPVIDQIPEIEYENLLYKCLKIVPELLKRGKFTNEGSIEQKAEKYERISNPWVSFIEKMLVDDESAVTPCWVFFNTYFEYCKKNNYRQPSKMEVTQKIKHEGYEVKKVRYGDNSYPSVFGLTTKEGWKIPDEDEGNVQPVQPVHPSSTRFPMRDCVNESASTGGTGGTELSQLVKITAAKKLILQHYGYQPISPAGIDFEADTLKESLSISKEDAVCCIIQAVNDIGRGL